MHAGRGVQPGSSCCHAVIGMCVLLPSLSQQQAGRVAGRACTIDSRMLWLACALIQQRTCSRSPGSWWSSRLQQQLV